ncbi:MAG: DNA (cytosine-5-)-methyltransferase [Gammaproteobacteria bacterium]|nr:MAG: DNA (cytosine-5-)-methyltransferase [Gammaproteobacteria bacterium]
MECCTYDGDPPNENHPECKIIVGDFTNPTIFTNVLKEAKNNKCKFLIATPPCQEMSIAGKMKKNDHRNYLIVLIVNFIKELKPDNIIIENVQGMLSTTIIIDKTEVKIIDYMTESLKKLKYYINPVVLDCADHGTPQNRKRAIILISKFKKWQLPKKEPQTTVEKAIGKLPSLESGQKSQIEYHYARHHNKRHIESLKWTPTGKTALDNKIYYPKKENRERIKGYSTTYKRIQWDKPAPTITMANGSISSQNNVHPGRLKKDGTYSDARVLTLKEIFILTGLPEKWHPPKWASENLIRQVIGEAVPPNLIDRLLSTIPAEVDLSYGGRFILRR